MLKKFFNWLSHFLRICILLVLTNMYSNMYSMTPKSVSSFLGYEYSKYAEFYADFKSVEIFGKKIHPEKVLCQTLLQVSSIEE
jgi:hypothetical protein